MRAYPFISNYLQVSGWELAKVPGSFAAAGLGSEGRRGGGRMRVLFGSEANQLRVPRSLPPTISRPMKTHMYDGK